MMKLRKTLFCAALALPLGACDGFPWPDLPAGAGDEPVALMPFRGSRPLGVPADAGSTWYAEVTYAADEWARVLGDVGCPRPFVVHTDGGYPVSLILQAEWPHADDARGMTGPENIYQPGFIDIEEYPDEDTRGRHRVLLHEMGHALGLDHHPRAKDGGYDGVMTPSCDADVPAAEEVREAAETMGCGEGTP